MELASVDDVSDIAVEYGERAVLWVGGGRGGGVCVVVRRGEVLLGRGQSLCHGGGGEAAAGDSATGGDSARCGCGWLWLWLCGTQGLGLWRTTGRSCRELHFTSVGHLPPNPPIFPLRLSPHNYHSSLPSSYSTFTHPVLSPPTILPWLRESIERKMLVSSSAPLRRLRCKLCPVPPHSCLDANHQTHSAPTCMIPRSHPPCTFALRILMSCSNPPQLRLCTSKVLTVPPPAILRDSPRFSAIPLLTRRVRRKPPPWNLRLWLRVPFCCPIACHRPNLQRP